MSEYNSENNESGLLLSVESTPERSLDFAGLSDDNDNVDADAEDNVGDTDGTDAADTDATDDADGTD